jgi:hypothetical protein
MRIKASFRMMPQVKHTEMNSEDTENIQPSVNKYHVGDELSLVPERKFSKASDNDSEIVSSEVDTAEKGNIASDVVDNLKEQFASVFDSEWLLSTANEANLQNEPVKQPAHIRFRHLLKPYKMKSAKAFPLPKEYMLLQNLFNSLEIVLCYQLSRKQTSSLTFHHVRKAIETQCDR